MFAHHNIRLFPDHDSHHFTNEIEIKLIIRIKKCNQFTMH